MGSTTTKAIVIEERDGGCRLVARGEAPTTVEAPQEDVMIGVRLAAARAEARLGRRLVREGRLITPQVGDEGVDLFVCTSSAGGGLQM
ncbi:MAG TPA: methylaspartate mutase, partial [Clostridiales bacterium]|nr:methylaspartate mutase [Clostridiales bacterium]